MPSNQPKNGNGDDGDAEYARCASPPCSMADVDPAYNGRMPVDEQLDLLNQLLEGERAGARGITEHCLPIATPTHHAALRDVAVDEGRFYSMLYRHIVRLNGIPSTQTGAFLNKLAIAETYCDRLELLNRGQGWIVRKLREVLPRIDNAVLHADLTEMLLVHERNIERYTKLTSS